MGPSASKGIDMEHEFLDVLHRINNNLSALAGSMDSAACALQSIDSRIEREGKWDYEIKNELSNIVSSLNFIGSVQDERL